MNKYLKIISLSIFIIVIFLIFYKKNYYNKSYSINEFGLNYNEFRKQNNIPLLPSNWILDNKDRDKIRSFSSPNAEQLGHRVKFINLLKSNLGVEIDKFYLSKDSILESRYERNTNNKFIYLHNFSSSTMTLITNKDANYLLQKYNIDFRFDNTW